MEKNIAMFTIMTIFFVSFTEGWAGIKENGNKGAGTWGRGK